MATVWTENGGSTRVVTFGIGVISGQVKLGDPVQVYDPNINITVWTAISADPE